MHDTLRREWSHQLLEFIYISLRAIDDASQPQISVYKDFTLQWVDRVEYVCHRRDDYDQDRMRIYMGRGIKTDLHPAN